MQNILITESQGYIGSQFLQPLLQIGVDPTKEKPRFFNALLIASLSTVLEGTLSLSVKLLTIGCPSTNSQINLSILFVLVSGFALISIIYKK